MTRFACTHPGCAESFSKPSDLNSHWDEVHYSTNKSLHSSSLTTCGVCPQCLRFAPYKTEGTGTPTFKKHVCPEIACPQAGCFFHAKTLLVLNEHWSKTHPGVARVENHASRIQAVICRTCDTFQRRAPDGSAHRHRNCVQRQPSSAAAQQAFAQNQSLLQQKAHSTSLAQAVAEEVPSAQTRRRHTGNATG